MKTSEIEEIKKWLRNFRVCIKNLNDKIDFYNDLVEISKKLITKNKKIELDKEYYFSQIMSIEDEIRNKIDIIEQCLSLLDENERDIIILKYMKGIGWDYISMHTFLSKSHSIRLHNSAVKKIAKNKELYKRIVD